jgi:hypothetical protein
MSKAKGAKSGSKDQYCTLLDKVGGLYPDLLSHLVRSCLTSVLSGKGKTIIVPKSEIGKLSKLSDIEANNLLKDHILSRYYSPDELKKLAGKEVRTISGNTYKVEVSGSKISLNGAEIGGFVEVKYSGLFVTDKALKPTPALPQKGGDFELELGGKKKKKRSSKKSKSKKMKGGCDDMEGGKKKKKKSSKKKRSTKKRGMRGGGKYITSVVLSMRGSDLRNWIVDQYYDAYLTQEIANMALIEGTWYHWLNASLINYMNSIQPMWYQTYVDIITLDPMIAYNLMLAPDITAKDYMYYYISDYDLLGWVQSAYFLDFNVNYVRQLNNWILLGGARKRQNNAMQLAIGGLHSDIAFAKTVKDSKTYLQIYRRIATIGNNTIYKRIGKDIDKAAWLHLQADILKSLIGDLCVAIKSKHAENTQLAINCNELIKKVASMTYNDFVASINSANGIELLNKLTADLGIPSAPTEVNEEEVNVPLGENNNPSPRLRADDDVEAYIKLFKDLPERRKQYEHTVISGILGYPPQISKSYKFNFTKAQSVVVANYVAKVLTNAAIKDHIDVRGAIDTLTAYGRDKFDSMIE